MEPTNNETHKPIAEAVTEEGEWPTNTIARDVRRSNSQGPFRRQLPP